MPWVCISSQASAHRPDADHRDDQARDHPDHRAARARSGTMSIISMEMWESVVTRTPATTKVSQTRQNLASSPVHGQPSIGR